MDEYVEREVGDERAMQLAIEVRQKSKASERVRRTHAKKPRGPMIRRTPLVPRHCRTTLQQ